MKKSSAIFLALSAMLCLSACSGGNASAAENPMLDPQVKVLQKQGIDASVMIFKSDGCKAKGFNEVFSIAKKLENISLSYANVTFGRYSDIEVNLAHEALVDSSFAQIELLKDIGEKAEKAGCKSIERRAYSNILASPVFSTAVAPVFQQDLMIAQSKLNQLGTK